MRLYPIIFVVLLASCGRNEPATHTQTYIPADLLTTEPGWRGPRPRTDGEFAEAAAAEKTGRERANAKLVAIKQIVDAE